METGDKLFLNSSQAASFPWERRRLDRSDGWLATGSHSEEWAGETPALPARVPLTEMNLRIGPLVHDVTAGNKDLFPI